MKRLIFPAILAALSICHSAYAQNGHRVYMTRMPSTSLTAAEKNESVLNEKVSPPVNGTHDAGASYGGFAGGCGCGDMGPGCCDNAWAGYSRGCGIHGLFARHRGACCDPCGGGLGGGFGGLGGCCWGNSFAGGCGGCFGNAGLGGLGSRLHHFGASCCSGLTQGCRGLFHGPGMFFGCDGACDTGCGCGNGIGKGGPGDYQGKPGLNAPPAPPAESIPATDAAPDAAPVPEKSAQRKIYTRPLSAFPASW